MSLAIRSILDGIASIIVPGVTVKDIDEIPESVSVRDCPILFPRPDGFISAFNVQDNSYGSASQMRRTVSYNLTYRLLYAPVGSGRGLFDKYDDMIVAAFSVVDAILGLDQFFGAVLIKFAGVANFSPVIDPSGNTFHGCDLVFEITEFVN